MNNKPATAGIGASLKVQKELSFEKMSMIEKSLVIFSSQYWKITEEVT